MNAFDSGVSLLLLAWLVVIVVGLILLIGFARRRGRTPSENAAGSAGAPEDRRRP